MLLLISTVFLLFRGCQAAGASASQRGQWTFVDGATGGNCIIMYAQIDLTLSYYSGTAQEQKDVSLTIPAASTPSGNCNDKVYINGEAKDSQQLVLDFDHMPGWKAAFTFTKTEALNLGDRQWMLYQVNITANYTSDPHFVNPSGDSHTYVQYVDPKNPPDLADTIYASKSYSLNCPSKQKFAINDDIKKGPLAYIQFSLLKLQAFKISSGSNFDQSETCPADQHNTDKVPIIVGGVLAGLTVITLVVYLVYRSRLPPEVINMVNPHSHYENKAIDDEENEEDEE
ncbi:unnamed protein product, partial [Mesorhabditis belari]|uniref:Lysosome-associated membrane glycoprotein 1 n=1 Tax=Mesorhabditis belari TaxID=2138241 RepID=A0AAF3FP27_9BILA